MIEMSEAKFEEAIAHFQQAIEYKSDYQIAGRPLLYTPIFMTSWAYEKLGNSTKACESFRLFIKRSGPLAEPTKKEHAERFIKNYCS
jgi:hypothetical protein